MTDAPFTPPREADEFDKRPPDSDAKACPAAPPRGVSGSDTANTVAAPASTSCNSGNKSKDRDEAVEKAADYLTRVVKSDQVLANRVHHVLCHAMRDRAWFERLYDAHKPERGRPPKTDAARVLQVLEALSGLEIGTSGRSRVAKYVQAAHDEWCAKNGFDAANPPPEEGDKAVGGRAIEMRSDALRRQREKADNDSSSSTKEGSARGSEEPAADKNGERAQQNAAAADPAVSGDVQGADQGDDTVEPSRAAEKGEQETDADLDEEQAVAQCELEDGLKHLDSEVMPFLRGLVELKRRAGHNAEAAARAVDALPGLLRK